MFSRALCFKITWILSLDGKLSCDHKKQKWKKALYRFQLLSIETGQSVTGCHLLPFKLFKQFIVGYHLGLQCAMGLVNQECEPFPHALYNVVQSLCNISSHDTLHHRSAKNNSLDNANLTAGSVKPLSFTAWRLCTIHKIFFKSTQYHLRQLHSSEPRVV